MKQPIAGFHQDDEQHWVADLACGHGQHVRHEPPWQVREWVLTEAGRSAMLGTPLECRKCDHGDPAAILALVQGRRGHFLMESGFHSALWLDLDALFTDTAAVAPLVDALAEAVRPHDVGVVCGPLLGGAFLAQLVAARLGASFTFTERKGHPAQAAALFSARYVLPAAQRDAVRGKRVAILDDVMSAGSSLRATQEAVVGADGTVACAGALLVLGGIGAGHFTDAGIPVVSVARDELATWAPAGCPLCARGVALERP